MEILHIERKGRMLNAMESYHICELTKQNLQMNEALTDSHNQIYDTLIKISEHTKSQPLIHPHTSFAPTPVSYPHPTPSLPPAPYKTKHNRTHTSTVMQAYNKPAQEKEHQSTTTTTNENDNGQRRLAITK
jgi:hypothetical protein